MSVRPAILLIGAASLMLPPVAVDARILVVPACGGAAHRMMIPGDPADPFQRRDCAKACHAITERRGKSGGVRKGCC